MIPAVPHCGPIRMATAVPTQISASIGSRSGLSVTMSCSPPKVLVT